MLTPEMAEQKWVLTDAAPDQWCRTWVRCECKSRPVRVQKLRDLAKAYEKSPEIVRHILQYLGFDVVHGLRDDPKMCTFIDSDVLHSAFVRTRQRYLRGNMQAGDDIPLIPVSSLSITHRSLDQLESQHIRREPTGQQQLHTLPFFVFRCQTIEQVRDYLVRCEFDCEAFADDGADTIWTTHAGVRFLETGCNFPAPESFHACVRKYGDQYGTVLMEACKHRPRCDTVHSRYYGDRFAEGSS